MPTRNVSSTVDEAMLQKARDMIGADTSAAEAVRTALQHFVDCGGAAPTAAAAVAAAPGAPGAPLAAARPFNEFAGEDKAGLARFLTKARQALRDALAYFVGENAVADTATKKRLRIEIVDLDADLKKMNARIQALLAGDLTMAPPPQATVERIGDLSEEIGRLTLEAQSADQIIAATKSVVGIWTEALA